jgi:hypothetical protein
MGRTGAAVEPRISGRHRPGREGSRALFLPSPRSRHDLGDHVAGHVGQAEVHLAPKSAQAIKRARKTYKDLRGQQYPIAEEDLAKRLPAVEVPATGEPVLHRPELSEQMEAEQAAIPTDEADDSGEAGS